MWLAGMGESYWGRQWVRVAGEDWCMSLCWFIDCFWIELVCMAIGLAQHYLGPKTINLCGAFYI